MQVNLRVAYMLRFKDGMYLGYHKKPGKAPNEKWLHGRKVDFEKAKIYPSRQSVGNAKQHVKEPVDIVQVYITHCVMETKVLEREKVQA